MIRAFLLGTALTAIALPALSQESPGIFTKPYWIDRPVIEALGRADLQVRPNRATFSVTYKSVGKTASEATRTASIMR